MWIDDVIPGCGVQLAVRDYGGNGRPLILVHGGPGQNLATWDHFVPYVLEDFRAVALDLRGNGASSDAVDYSYPALASDIRAIASFFGLSRPIVVGHSWGGQVAVFYASRYPDCAGVVGIDGWVTDVAEAVSSEAWKWLEDEYAADPLLNFCGTHDQLARVLEKVAELYGAAGADVARRQFVPCGDGMFRWRRTVSQLASIERTVAEEGTALTTALYQSIRCPVLLIGAERSEPERMSADPEGRFGPWAFSASATERVVRRFPDVRVMWLPCGHDIPTEMPEELARALREFAR